MPPIATWNPARAFRTVAPYLSGLRRARDGVVDLCGGGDRRGVDQGAPGRAAARLADPDRAVLLLDRRPHVADPRRLHGVRGRGRPPQEHHVDGDEEHPHHRRRHADVLLLRLVHLRLHGGGVAEVRPRLARRVPRLLRPDGPVERGDGAEPPGSRQPRLLPRLPPLLLDDRVDHVRRPDRADPPVRVPPARSDARLGRLDSRRRLGLELRRLADDALRLPRLDRLGRRPRRRRSVHARRPAQPRAADREVRHRRAARDPSGPTTPT